MTAGGYAELQALSAFSFREGASMPEELARRAAELELAAIGVADRNSLAGVVRAHMAAKQVGLRSLTGARLDLADGPSLLAYPEGRPAYGRLSRLITVGRRRAPKGECELYPADLLDHGDGLILLALPPPVLSPAFARDLADAFVVMDRGELVLSGQKEDMVEADVRRYLTV